MIQEVAYGEHPSQRCELRLPDGLGPFPVAALMHGGCFRQGYSSELMLPLCDDLVGRGWAAWNVEYRRLGVRGGGGWPATFDDIGAAIDVLAGLDAPLDLGRLAAIGHSAGGCLALWAGGRADGAVRVEAAVGQAPLADLVACAREDVCGDQVPTLLDGGPNDRPDRYRAASPAARLPLRCRTLVVHGALDDTVPQAHSVAFAQAAGERCTAVLPADGDHMEHIDPGSASWRAVIEWL